MDCYMCRSGYERLSDEEIRKRLDRAIAQGDEQLFDDMVGQLGHMTYHRRSAWLQPADANDAAQDAIEKVLRWKQRKQIALKDNLPSGQAAGNEIPKTDTVDGKTVVGLFISKLITGFRVKGRWVPGEELKLQWKIERQGANEISMSEPDGDEESSQTVGDTLRSPNMLCEDDQEADAVAIQAIAYAITCLDTVVGGMKKSILREALDGMSSYARNCMASSTVPVIVSAGIRYKNKDGELIQMKRNRLGGALVQQRHGRPLGGLDHLKAQAPSLEIMQWQVHPEVSAYLRDLPGWNALSQDAFYQRQNRAVDKLTEENLLQLVPLILEGDDYDVLHLS
ncbi:MAG TPA: hypothetical protein PKD12_02785 [Nitrospira sp.]|nr:hypothetical protein [Nitrospira sp.]